MVIHSNNKCVVRIAMSRVDANGGNGLGRSFKLCYLNRGVSPSDFVMITVVIRQARSPNPRTRASVSEESVSQIIITRRAVV